MWITSNFLNLNTKNNNEVEVKYHVEMKLQFHISDLIKSNEQILNETNN